MYIFKYQTWYRQTYRYSRINTTTYHDNIAYIGYSVFCRPVEGQSSFYDIFNGIKTYVHVYNGHTDILVFTVMSFKRCESQYYVFRFYSCKLRGGVVGFNYAL
jgi:hypothetical protein